MEKIRIITDSASDFESVDSSLITILPMNVRIGETDYRDGIDISHRRFYEMLIESDELPTTSLISPGVFHDAFEEAVGNGERVIAVVVSSKLSGTWQSAMIAAEDFPGEVTVIDSLSGSVGEQVMIGYAEQMIRENIPYEEICQRLTDSRKKLHILGLLDTLEYLKKGGRIPASVAFVGGVLHIKPVFTLVNGALEMLGTARGSKKGNNFLIKEIQKIDGIDFEKPIRLGYTGLDDSCLQKYIKDSEPLWAGHGDCLEISSVGAAIGTHLGPGAILVAFYEK